MAFQYDEYGGVTNPEDAGGGYGDFSVDEGQWAGSSPQMTQPQGRFYGEPSPLPYGEPKNPYPVTTGVYGTQPPSKAYGIEDQKGMPNTLGSKPFFVPSGQGAYGGRIPGQAYNASGPTGQFMTPPTMGPMPEFNLPVWDEGKIGSLAQKAAGPGLREMKKGLREAQGRYYENPNVRRMTLRDAMAGYGMGIEKVMAGARREAQAEYAQEFAPQMTKAQMEYQAKTQGVMNQYQNAWREYLTRMSGGGGVKDGLLRQISG